MSESGLSDQSEQGPGRRRVGRVRTSLPVEWDMTEKYLRYGKIISLSSRGCLIETGQVEPLHGRTIYMRLPMPNRDWLLLQGVVIYYLRDVGFAVEFEALTNEDKSILMQMMRYYREHPPERGGDSLWQRFFDLFRD